VEVAEDYKWETSKGKRMGSQTQAEDCKGGGCQELSSPFKYTGAQCLLRKTNTGGFGGEERLNQSWPFIKIYEKGTGGRQ